MSFWEKVRVGLAVFFAVIGILVIISVAALLFLVSCGCATFHPPAAKPSAESVHIRAQWDSVRTVGLRCS